MASRHDLKRSRSENVPRTRDLPTVSQCKPHRLHRAKTDDNHSSRYYKQRTEKRKVPRKLGPRDIGRAKYSGTVYIDNDSCDFLAEKIHKHARSSSFAERKSKNPLKKKETVQEIGSPNGWNKPSFFQQWDHELKTIQLDKWLKERPMKPPNNALDALKNEKVQKRPTVSELDVSPLGWDCIDYEYKAQFGGFLNEKLWFEGSRAPILQGLSQMIAALPSERKLELKALPSPRGIHSKINFLKKLRDMVMEQVQIMHRAERRLRQFRSQRTLKVIENFEKKGNNAQGTEQSDTHYQKLLQDRESAVGKSRRKLFTMKSVKALDQLIQNMQEKQ